MDPIEFNKERERERGRMGSRRRQSVCAWWLFGCVGVS